MPRSSTYEPVLAGKAATTLVALSKSRQKQVIKLAFQLAQPPMQRGDYVTTDETGRRIENLLIGEWHFSFWADHATKELRITDITEV